VGAWLFLAAAALLSLERICYIWISRAPDAFRAWCARPLIARLGEPVDVVHALFLTFKAIQGVVFVGWCYWNSGGDLFPLPGPPWAVGLGCVLVLSGQVLSTSVFHQLGKVGVFYGSRLGHDVPWCTGFPFTHLAHPQYVGTVMSIWGVFLIARFPNPDWIVLPVLETVYYSIGAHYESNHGQHG
jgi:phosphatidyl-N-methylethanolamine N-methyltransferase